MIVLYNPHIDDLIGEFPYFKLRGRKSAKKYEFLILNKKNKNEKIKILSDATASAVFPCGTYEKIPKVIRKIISYIELKLWIRLNGLQKNCEIKYNNKNLDSNDTLLIFSYKAMTGAHLMGEKLSSISNFGHVVAHLSHYFMWTAIKSENLKKITNIWLAGDSDISDNSYFKEYYSWYQKPFLVLPFNVAEKFECVNRFSQRKPLCIATGTIIDLKNEFHKSRHSEFQKFYSENSYHPIREKIYKEKNSISEFIVSIINPVRGEKSGGLIMKLLSKIKISQKEYFSINIKDLYNEYRFAVVGEELTGFPAIGAFEAMACGTVLIGDSKHYKGLGLIAGKHYLEHNGSLNCIMNIIKNTKNNIEIIEEIQKNGISYVRERMSMASIEGTWKQELENKVYKKIT